MEETEETEEKIAIVVDGSVCSLSSGQLPVPVDAVVEFYVVYHEKGKEVSKAQNKMSWGEIIDLQKGREIPRTSTPSIGDFLNTYRHLVNEGFNRILVLTVPKKLSGVYNSAIKAREALHNEYPDVEVAVIDTGTTASGVEYLAEVAIEARSAGKSLEEIQELLTREARKVEIIVAFDTLRFVAASGRIDELNGESLKDNLKRHVLGAATQFVDLVHRSPKMVAILSGGKIEILWPFKRHFVSAVEKLQEELRKRHESRGIKRLYIIFSAATEEVVNLKKKIGGFYTGSIITRSEVPLALLTIAGSKVVAVVVIYE